MEMAEVFLRLLESGDDGGGDYFGMDGMFCADGGRLFLRMSFDLRLLFHYR